MRTRVHARLLSAASVAALALVLAGGRLEAGAPALSQTFLHPTHRFRLVYFKDWAIEPDVRGADGVVCSASDAKKRGESKGRLTARLDVWRLPRAASPLPPGAAGDAFQVMTDDMQVEPGTLWPREPSTPITSADGLAGRLWEATALLAMRAGTPPSPARERTVHVTLAAFHAAGAEYGLRLACDSSESREYKPTFRRLAEAFVVGPVGTEAAVGSQPVPEERWDATGSESRRFTLLHRRGERRVGELLARLDQLGQSLRRELPFIPWADVVGVVRLCANESEYLAWGGPSGTAARFDDGREEIVCYRPHEAGDGLDAWGLLHSAVVQHALNHAFWPAWPQAWFMQGLSNQYSFARGTPKGLEVGADPAQWRDVRDATRQGASLRLPTTAGAAPRFAPGGYLPMRALISLDDDQFYADQRRASAQAGSLVAFLRGVRPNDGAPSGAGDLLVRYSAALQRAVRVDPARARPSVEQARAAALAEIEGTVDWDALEAAWLAWLR